jgi:phosphate transport system protein
MKPHSDQDYEEELHELRGRLRLMGSVVSEMIGGAVEAFEQRDAAKAREIIARDRVVNGMELEIDDLSLRILARRQPVASDLRFVTSALKAVTDLERLGDLAVNMGERVVELGGVTAIPAEVTQVGEIAKGAREMLGEALAAFVDSDVARAEKVLSQDRAVDSAYERLLGGLIEAMSADPTRVYAVTRVQSMAKYLERVADHATNLAELVFFVVRGEDVRHQKHDGG